ncbi:MAG: radical SAM protein [Selenomonadales bacterium]|nr:radical SAM protein [Selenomonadales bacterium]
MEGCKLCPRMCNVVRKVSEDAVGAVGFCGMSRTVRVAKAMLHAWEEPCISGMRGSGAVFFSGCHLGCIYCQNHEIAGGFGKDVSTARLREIYGELIAQGAHNINLVTASHYLDSVIESLDEPLGVPVVYNCGGYERVESLRRLAGKVQIYLPDMKYMDSSLAERYSHASDYPHVAQAVIREMVRQVGPYVMGDDGILKSGVIIRHLLLPDAVDNTKRVIDWVADEFSPHTVLFSLMRQYTPCRDLPYSALNRRVTDEEYREVEDYLFDSGIEDGFVQEEESADEGYIPKFDLSGV